MLSGVPGEVLCLVFCIPLTGITIRVYRGGELKLGEWDGMFLDGLLATIISIIYLVPYYVISTLLDYGPMANFAHAHVFAALIIELVVLLITYMIRNMGLIRFAKSSGLVQRSR